MNVPSKEIDSTRVKIKSGLDQRLLQADRLLLRAPPSGFNASRSRSLPELDISCLCIALGLLVLTIHPLVGARSN